MIKKLQQLNSDLSNVLFVLFIPVLILGCNKNEQPVSALAPQQVIKQPTNPVQKLLSSSIKLTSSNSTSNQFDFSSKKDPFKPYGVVKAVSTQSKSDIRKSMIDSLPIHSFDVSQFKLIGVITGAKENQAMVVDPNGKGYVLKFGMTIGKNEGKVVAITSNGVDVLEQFKDDNGRVRKENIRITLPRKQ